MWRQRCVPKASHPDFPAAGNTQGAQQASNQTLRKLIDAKLHLFYAGHELQRDDDNSTIRKELRSTDGYLGEALAEARPEIRKRVTQVRLEVAAIDAGLDNDREEAKSPL